MRLFLFLLIAYCVYIMFRGKIKHSAETRHTQRHEGEVTHKDPVCGVYVTEEDAIIGRLDDKKVYFCSMECLEKYRDSLKINK